MTTKITNHTTSWTSSSSRVSKKLRNDPLPEEKDGANNNNDKSNNNNKMCMFTGIHKGIRHWLAQTALLAGATDFSSPSLSSSPSPSPTLSPSPSFSPHLSSLVLHFQFLVRVLRDHAHHEDTHIFPHVVSVDPKYGAELQKEHIELEEELKELETLFHTALTTEESKRGEAGLTFYRQLTGFQGKYLLHQLEEETQLMPFLWDHFSSSQLMEMLQRILQSVSYNDLLEQAAGLVGSSTLAEQKMYLGGWSNFPKDQYRALVDKIREGISSEQWDQLKIAVPGLEDYSTPGAFKAGLKLTLLLNEYISNLSAPSSPLFDQLISETRKLEWSIMQVPKEEAQLLSILVKSISAKKALEVGVYTGMSSLAIATSLGEGGTLIACDINKEWTDVARKYWKLAKVEHVVDLRLAPALHTLSSLLQQPDADKENYSEYYDHILQLLRPGGMLVVDNTLWGGVVATNNNNINNDDINDMKKKKNEQEEGGDSVVIKSMRVFNVRVSQDTRVQSVVLPVADGITVIIKN